MRLQTPPRTLVAEDQPRRSAPVNVDGVSVERAGRKILTNVDLDAAAASTVGILGPNGSGKSTLLRTMFRSVRPSSGGVYVDGASVWHESVAWNAQQTAVVLQETASEFPLTCVEVVQMGRTVHKRLWDGDSAHDAHLCHAAMNLTGIVQLADRYFNRLSGGERQRVLIARALVQQPRVLIMDEPTNHLDLHHQLSLLKTATELPSTVIVALHDLNLAARYCDTIMLLDDGHVVAHGEPWNVLTVDRIKQVYRVNVQRIEHPETGHPHILVC